MFELFLALLYHFGLIYHFSCFLLVLRLFLHLYDLLELFLAFGLLVVLYGVLDSKFKLCVFCYQLTHQGGIKKPSGQYLSLICDESLTC
jgi:hypothetical protein